MIQTTHSVSRAAAGGILFLTAIALPVLGPPAAAQAVGESSEAPKFSPGDLVPPAFREATFFAAAREFVLSLPEGTDVFVQRNDGSAFSLRLTGGRLKASVPGARIENDGATYVSPFGYRVGKAPGKLLSILVEAPNGKSTLLTPTAKTLYGREEDGGKWDIALAGAGFRLPDGTRFDMLGEGVRWEALSLDGARFRLDAANGLWTEMPRLPSPPLIPDQSIPYVAGDGDDWRVPAKEDHVVFGWNWYPYGFELQGLLDAIDVPVRREDLRLYFIGLKKMPEPHELGTAMIARRLSLGGGDVVTIAMPDEEPLSTFLLPGPLDPDFFLMQSMPRSVKGSVSPDR